MGQFTDYVDEIAFEGFNYKERSDTEFDEVINRRDDAHDQLNAAYKTLTSWPKIRRQTPDDRRLLDIWQTIRHQFWLDKPPEQKSTWTVDSRQPLNLSGDKPIKVMRVDRK